MRRLLLLLLLLASPVLAQRIVIITGGTVTANVTDSADFYVTLNQNVTGVTLTSTVTPATGYIVSMKFVQDATGSRTVTFGGTISTSCSVNSTALSVTICRWQYTASTNLWTDAAGGGVSPLFWLDARAAGMLCDNATDDTTAMTAALTTLYNQGGGTLMLPAGKTCKIAGQITLPNNAASPPTQKSIRITGSLSGANGIWGGGIPGTTAALNLTFNASIAKIDTRGQGLLEIDHVSLTDSSNDCAAFIQTTNTTLHIHDTLFSGTATGTSACNDAVIYGGTSSSIDGSSTSPFQGYGSYLFHNWFDKIRRAALLQQFANNIQISENTISTTCGTALTNGAAFELGTTGSFSVYGNYFAGNLIEVTNYKFGFNVSATSASNTFVGNGIWDIGTSIGGYSINGNLNVVISGHSDWTSTTEVTRDAGGAPNTTNIVITGNNGGLSTQLPGLSSQLISSSIAGLLSYTAGPITNSPSICWAGSYQATGGPTYAQDKWCLQDAPGAGTNGTGFFNITHSGSTQSAVSVSGGLQADALRSSGSTFTLSSNPCSGTSLVGGGTGGKFLSGTTGTCTVTVTIGSGANKIPVNGWTVHGGDITTGTLLTQTASTATTASFNVVTTSGDTVVFSMLGW